MLLVMMLLLSRSIRHYSLSFSLLSARTASALLLLLPSCYFYCWRCCLPWFAHAPARYSPPPSPLPRVTSRQYYSPACTKNWAIYVPPAVTIVNNNVNTNGGGIPNTIVLFRRWSLSKDQSHRQAWLNAVLLPSNSEFKPRSKPENDVLPSRKKSNKKKKIKTLHATSFFFLVKIRVKFRAISSVTLDFFYFVLVYFGVVLFFPFFYFFLR